MHAEAHRPTGSATPPYFSRHYFDLTALLDTEEGKAAAIDVGLMATVAKHKARFFRTTWAQYETARSGTLRLTPSNARIDELRADYPAMSPMMFDEPPIAFDDILERLQRLQNTING